MSQNLNNAVAVIGVEIGKIRESEADSKCRQRVPLLQKRGAPQATHNQGLDRSALVTKVSVNIKIDVQRVGLNLRKSRLGSAYGARV